MMGAKARFGAKGVFFLGHADLEKKDLQDFGVHSRFSAFHFFGNVGGASSIERRALLSRAARTGSERALNDDDDDDENRGGHDVREGRGRVPGGGPHPCGAAPRSPRGSGERSSSNFFSNTWRPSFGVFEDVLPHSARPTRRGRGFAPGASFRPPRMGGGVGRAGESSPRPVRVRASPAVPR